MPSKPRIKIFKTTSDHGDKVSYTIIPWPASDGFVIVRRLAPLGAQAIKVFNNLSNVDGLNDAEGSGLDVDLEALFLGITGDIADSVSEAVTGIAHAIMAEGDDEFVRDILVNTSRACGDEVLKVGKKHDFDQAYTANYGEMVIALAQTLAANGGGILKRFGSKKN